MNNAGPGGESSGSSSNAEDELAVAEECLENDEEIRLHILGANSFFCQF